MATPVACVITARPAARQARLQRELPVLRDLGFCVHVIGGPSADAFDDWKFTPLDYFEANISRAAYVRLLASRLLTTIFPGLVDWVVAMWPASRRCVDVLKAINPALVICHNHHYLPAASRLAERHGVPLVVIMAEHALSQSSHSLFWRLFERPYVRAIVQKYLPKADRVVTVSKGLAQQYDAEVALPRRTDCVRSVPPYQQQPLNVPGEMIEVLYHGKAAPNDLLDVVIDSVPLWHRRYRLVLRVDANTYVDSLRSRAQALGIEARVAFESFVPMNEVVAAANRADIGLFVTRRGIPQREHVLPNKFFEYIMAGLALCVSSVPEMAGVVSESGNGVLIDEVTPQTIAESLNALTVKDIVTMKIRSLELAKSLCWETEKERFAAIIRDVMVQSSCHRGSSNVR